MTRAITVWQPHATLLIRPRPSTGKPAKRYETRGWYSEYRGTLVIHAAMNESGLYLCMTEPFRSILAELGYDRAEQLPLGAALGFVDMVGCPRTNDLIDRIDPLEKRFGDFGPNRFAHEYANPRFFKEPIKISGKQGFWDFAEAYYADAEIQKAIEKA